MYDSEISLNGKIGLNVNLFHAYANKGVRVYRNSSRGGAKVARSAKLCMPQPPGVPRGRAKFCMSPTPRSS